MNKSLFLLLFMLSFSFLFASGKEDSLSKAQEQAENDNDSWNVFLLEPESSADMDNLARSFVNQLHRELQNYDYHQLSEEEQNERREEQFLQQQNALFQQLERLIDQRDDLLFKKASSVDIDKKKGDIREQRALIAELKPESINVADRLPLNIMSFSEDQWLYPMDTDQWPEKSDRILKCRFIDLNDWFLLEIWLLDSRGNTLSRLFRDRGDTDQLAELQQKVKTQILDALLGRDWAAIDLKAEPVNAAVYSEDTLLGLGEVPLRQLTPGTINLTIKAPGYISKSLELNLQKGVNEPQSVVLEKKEPRIGYIETTPAGADVYIGSRWMGVTPLGIELPEDNLSVLLSYPDYSQQYLASNELKEHNVISLEPLKENWEEELEMKKKKYYNSLAAFTLSLIFPVVMQGVQENRLAEYEALVRNGVDDISDEKDAYRRSYYTYGAAISVSSGFLVYHLYRLIDYIGTAERSILEE